MSGAPQSLRELRAAQHAERAAAVWRSAYARALGWEADPERAADRRLAEWEAGASAAAVRP